MSITSSVHPNRGFHFGFSTNLSLNPIGLECDLYLQYQFPADVYVDRYELEERGLQSHLRGESNLELPLAAVERAGSTLEVRVPSSMTVDVPFHARYPLPSTSPISIVRLLEPQAFWACPTPNRKVTNLSLQSTYPYLPSLDLDSWSITFRNETDDLRYHEIQVPAGSPAHVIFVEFGTAFVILSAFLYVLRALWITNTRMRHPRNSKPE